MPNMPTGEIEVTAERALDFVRGKYGERDPRVLTLRSIIATCAIGEAMMQLVFSAVHNAMNDSESVLSRAINAAFKVGVGTPARWLFGAALASGDLNCDGLVDLVGGAQTHPEAPFGERVRDPPQNQPATSADGRGTVIHAGIVTDISSVEPGPGKPRGGASQSGTGLVLPAGLSTHQQLVAASSLAAAGRFQPAAVRCTLVTARFQASSCPG